MFDDFTLFMQCEELPGDEDINFQPTDFDNPVTELYDYYRHDDFSFYLDD